MEITQCFMSDTALPLQLGIAATVISFQALNIYLPVKLCTQTSQ
jgi:hypothetical protein